MITVTKARKQVLCSIFPSGKPATFPESTLWALCEHGIVLGKGSKTAITYSMRVCNLTWYLKNNLEKRTRTSLTAYCFLTQFFLSCLRLHLLLTLPGASRRMGGIWGAAARLQLCPHVGLLCLTHGYLPLLQPSPSLCHQLFCKVGLLRRNVNPRMSKWSS